MAIRLVSTADRGVRYDGSYARNIIDLGCGIGTFEWSGYCMIPANGAVASLDVIIPFQDGKGGADTIGLTLEPNSFITKVGLQLLGSVTMGAAAGRLKLAPTINEAVASQYTESGAATAGTLSPAGFMRRQTNPFNATVSTGATPVTYRLFATDGGVGAAAAPSTVSATKETKVLVTLAGYIFIGDPTELDVGISIQKAK